MEAAAKKKSGTPNTLPRDLGLTARRTSTTDGMLETKYPQPFRILRSRSLPPRRFPPAYRAGVVPNVADGRGAVGGGRKLSA